MAMQLMIPAYVWSLITLWNIEIKETISGGKTVEEVVVDNIELEHSWEFITKQLPRYNKEE
jgi:hypothetical protein